MFEDDAKAHVIDQAKEQQRAKKTKDRKAKKKQNRLARMRAANAQENAADGDDVAEKSTKANGKVTTNATNGSASKSPNVKGSAPQRRLRGSRQ